MTLVVWLGRGGPVAALALLGAWLLLHFNAHAVQSGDAWIAYLPGAVAASRLDPALLRESLAFGYGRPLLPPLSIAFVQAVLPITFPQAAQLLAVGASVAVGGLIVALVRPAASSHFALATALVGLSSPAVATSMVYTTPDMGFAALALGAAWAFSRGRAGLALALTALALLCRANALALVPALLLFLATRPRPRKWKLTCAGAVLLAAGLARAAVAWGKPGASLMSSPAQHWHASIFVDGATGWSLGVRLRFDAAAQYGRLLRRVLVDAPWDVLSHWWRADGVSSAAHLGFGLALLAGLGLGLGSRWRARRVRSHELSIALAVAGLYVPMALFHWEVRYMLPVYLALVVLGGRAVGGVLPRRAGWVALLGALLLLAPTNRALEARFQPRAQLGLDDSGYEYVPAQAHAKEVLARLLAGVRARPVRLLGCETMPVPYYNYERVLKHPDEVLCVGRRFQRPIGPGEVDAWVHRRGAAYEAEPLRTLAQRAAPIFEDGELTFVRIRTSSTSAP